MGEKPVCRFSCYFSKKTNKCVHSSSYSQWNTIIVWKHWKMVKFSEWRYRRISKGILLSNVYTWKYIKANNNTNDWYRSSECTFYKIVRRYGLRAVVCVSLKWLYVDDGDDDNDSIKAFSRCHLRNLLHRNKYARSVGTVENWAIIQSLRRNFVSFLCEFIPPYEK